MIAAALLLRTAIAIQVPILTDLPIAPQSLALPRRGTLGVGFAAVPADMATLLNLPTGSGLLAREPIANLTAAKAGLRANDVLVAVNGMPVGPGLIQPILRELQSGEPIRFSILREGAKQELQATFTEKPRDPGNENFSVDYSHVLSNGQRMRTIISQPKSSGKHPALLFIQGLAPLSYDYNLAGGQGDVSRLGAPILFEFANTGFVTLRVEKPGVGDSEGGPYPELDFNTEIDIYRQALKQLKAHPAVDPEKVFIFGHSMGGSFGPLVAAENPVRGVAVYATVGRTWREYLHDILRYQGLLGGDTYASADDSVRFGSRIMDLVLQQDMTPVEVKEKYPELGGMVDGLFPGGLFNGKRPIFWRQLENTNFAAAWSKTDTRVLAIHGSSDFVSYRIDHETIAAMVNREHPTWGEFASAANSDHFFNEWPSEAEALRNYSTGPYNPAVQNLLMDWTKRTLAAP